MLFKKAPFFERVLQSEGKSHSLFKPAVMQMDVDELRSFSRGLSSFLRISSRALQNNIEFHLYYCSSPLPTASTTTVVMDYFPLYLGHITF